MTSLRHVTMLTALLGLALAMQSPASAAEVSLPLEGHYRPGRFIPVRVSHAGSGQVQISAPGCVTTVIANPAEADVVVPFLAASDSVRALQISNVNPVELKLLRENQRLVVTAEADGKAARGVFPDDELIAVSPDLNRPLLEPVMAWTGVDAVVLSPAARARVSDKQISVLLAGGVVLVVAGEQKPDERWPWERMKDAWVLRHEVAGPREPVRAEAYSPTYVWDRGVPGAVRRQIVFVAVVFAILAVGLSLWRAKFALVAFLGLCVAAGTFVSFAYLRGPRELTMQKMVVVRNARMSQGDDWVWYACLRDSRLRYSIGEQTLPVFASGKQIERCAPRLICDPQGRPVAYDFRLGAKESLAFVTRSVWTTPENAKAPTFSPTEPPWKEFVSNLYVGSEDRLEGEATFEADWNATYVSRKRR